MFLHIPWYFLPNRRLGMASKGDLGQFSVSGNNDQNFAHSLDLRLYISLHLQASCGSPNTAIIA